MRISDWSSDVCTSDLDGALAGAGDVQRDRFALTTEARLSFDSFANNSQLRWRLSGPGYDYEAALNRADGYDQASRTPMLLAPGDYELLIDGTGDAAGPYAFRLLDVRAAATLVDGHGETVTGALAPASETRVHAIDLAEGESFPFDARQAPANAAFRLLDPFGRDLPVS